MLSLLILIPRGQLVSGFRQPTKTPRLPRPVYSSCTCLFLVHRLQVHELFVEHLKKSKVNVIGAFILANDVNRLQVLLVCRPEVIFWPSWRGLHRVRVRACFGFCLPPLLRGTWRVPLNSVWCWMLEYLIHEKQRLSLLLLLLLAQIDRSLIRSAS